MTKKLYLAVLFVMAGILALPLQTKAEGMSPALAYGYKRYFELHPPKDKPLKYNLYPYAGPVIPAGQDIPICAAAKTEEAYAKKREIRYLIHGKDGWIFRTSDFRSDFTATPKTMEYFKRLNNLLKSQGQTLVVVFQPPRALVSAKHIDPAAAPKDYAPDKAHKAYLAFIEQLSDAGIETVDLSTPASDINYFGKGDFHWSPEGSADSAKKVAAALKDLSAYGDMPKQDFVSEVTGMAPADRGAFEEFLQQTCKMNIELTTKSVWATHPKAEGTASAKDLLGDAPFPAITVIGTSNSAEDDKFNFVGALKHFARTDIYNAALTGGGFGSSAYRYYASDEYHEHPPKVIVWEFLPQHNYNNNESAQAFRQMIPAIYGACSKDHALAEYTGNIMQNQTEFFTQIKDKPLKNTYLYLDVTDPKERNLEVEILYKNGDADQVDLSRTTRMDNNGKYYLELGNAADNNAVFFHVKTDQPQGRMTARICPYPVNVAEK